MKVVLVRYHDSGNINTRLPQSLNKVQGVLPPLGLAYIASSLEKAGFDVEILDAQALALGQDDVREYLARRQPGLVGVTTMTANFRGGLEACELAKECGATVVIGGVHVEIFAEETLSCNCIDYGIAGEAEEAFVELASALRDNTDPRSVQGLVYRDGGRVIMNGVRLVNDIDSLPPPARHLLPNERYSSIIGLHPTTTMITSRGCPFHCAFCYKQHAHSSMRFRTAPRIVDEMEDVVTRYGVREVMFYDDTITSRKSHIESLCKEILKRRLKVKWEAPSRIDTVDTDLLRLMKDAGCVRLRFGVESGNPEILEKMNKKIRLEQVERVVRDTRAAGIEVFAYFILGYLGDTDASMGDTIRFARSLRPDLAMFTVATPYPGTQLFREACAAGMVSPTYWRDFVLGKDVGRIPYLVPDADRWVRRAYRSLYLDPRFVLRKLLEIRSMDQVRKMWQAFLGLISFNMSEN